MSVDRYIVYRNSDGYVENLILLDPASDWLPPTDCSIEKIEENTAVAIGWTRESELVYIAPIEPVLPLTIEEVTAQNEKVIASLNP